MDCSCEELKNSFCEEFTSGKIFWEDIQNFLEYFLLELNQSNILLDDLSSAVDEWRKSRLPNLFLGYCVNDCDLPTCLCGQLDFNKLDSLLNMLNDNLKYPPILEMIISHIILEIKQKLLDLDVAERKVVDSIETD